MQKARTRDASTPVGRWGVREAGIIEVATRLFSDRDYDGVTMAQVASACGLSEGTLYNYFRDKSDLAVRASLVTFDRHADEAEAIVQDATDLRQGLEKLIALELTILLEARGMMRVWLREVRGAQDYPNSPSRGVLRRFSGNLIQLFEKFHAFPDPKTGLNFSLLRDIVFGSAEHVVWTAYVQGRLDTLDVERLSRDLAAAYLRAFAITPKKARTRTKPKGRAAREAR